MLIAAYTVLTTLALAAATPAAAPADDNPQIHGARVFGVRPGSPFLFTIAATGKRPMTFAAAGLPQGLQLDPQLGQIRGSLTVRGTFAVELRASNRQGTAERGLRIVVGDEVSLTPPMGCNTWGGWGPKVTDANIRASARAMVDRGLAQHGYCYINIDDGWQGPRGGKFHAIQPNEKFGDMRALCDTIHALGLKAGIYSTPWTTSYAGFTGGSSDQEDGDWAQPKPVTRGWRHGRYTFFPNDARQFAEWGFDYCKYDWNIDRVGLAQQIADSLRACKRDFVLELSNSAPLAHAKEFTSLAQMCRTTGDIVDVWDKSQLDPGKRKWALGVRDIWNQHKAWEPFNRPGHWNMPCPLRVGLLGGWDLKPLRPTRLTRDEQYTHISLWCMWSAPLIIGCPLELLDDFTLQLLTNDEVLDLDQDPLGKQARQVEVNGQEFLVKDLEDGSKAVGLFNLTAAEATIKVRWSDLGIASRQRVRDLWQRRDLGLRDQDFEASVRPHGVVLIRVTHD